MLVLKTGDTVSIDAIGCQKDIVKKIKERKCDYLIALKKNQGNLWAEAENFFIQVFDAEDVAPVETFTTAKCSHGRIDSQKLWITTDLDWLKMKKDWAGLCTLVCVEREWKGSKEPRKERRYYIASMQKTAEEFAVLVRRHWAIENEYHWHLDVNFSEDNVEIKARSNRILRVARTIALQLLKAEKTVGLSIRQKKKKCHRSEDFMTKVLMSGNF